MTMDQATPDSLEQDLAGRDTTVLYRRFCAMLALLAVGAGLVSIAGSHFSDKVFAWETASPLNLLLLGGLFLGAVPLMVGGALETTWERNRIAVIPGAVLVIALTVATLRNLGDTFIGGGAIVALGFSAVWILVLIGTSIWALVGIPGQLAEPALPLEKIQSLPGWTVPFLALQGSGWFGLGLAYFIRPELGERWIPWDVAPLDVAALGAVCLTLGTAMLQALTEDDLERVTFGLYTLVAVGLFGLLALSVKSGEVDWSSWTGPIPALLLVGMTATGALGHLILRRATRAAAGERMRATC